MCFNGFFNILQTIKHILVLQSGNFQYLVFFLLCGLWLYLLFVFKIYFFYWNILDTCDLQEKVASRPKVNDTGNFSEKKSNSFLEVCCIKPFLGGLHQILILWTRIAGTGPGLYKKQMCNMNAVLTNIAYQVGKARQVTCDT